LGNSTRHREAIHIRSLAPVSDYSRALTADLSGLTLGVPRQLFFDDLDDEVRRAVRRAIADLKRAGRRRLCWSASARSRRRIRPWTHS